MDSHNVHSVQAAVMLHAQQCAVNRETTVMQQYSTLDRKDKHLPEPPINPGYQHVRREGKERTILHRELEGKKMTVFHVFCSLHRESILVCMLRMNGLYPYELM